MIRKFGRESALFPIRLAIIIDGRSRPVGFRAQLQFAATAYDPFETFVTGSFWEGCIRRAIEQP